MKKMILNAERDSSWTEVKKSDLEEICDNFRILECQRDLYRGRCQKLQQENEQLKRMLDRIQMMVCQYSNG